MANSFIDLNDIVEIKAHCNELSRRIEYDTKQLENLQNIKTYTRNFTIVDKTNGNEADIDNDFTCYSSILNSAIEFYTTKISDEKKLYNSYVENAISSSIAQTPNLDSGFEDIQLYEDKVVPMSNDDSSDDYVINNEAYDLDGSD